MTEARATWRYRHTPYGTQERNEQCPAITLKGDRCKNRGIYELNPDGLWLVCAIHRPSVNPRMAQ